MLWDRTLTNVTASVPFSGYFDKPVVLTGWEEGSCTQQAFYFSQLLRVTG